MRTIFQIVYFKGVALGELSPDVDQLCQDYWEWRLMDMPQYATFVSYSKLWNKFSL